MLTFVTFADDWQRRWGPIRAIQGLRRVTANGLSRAVSAPVKRIRSRRGSRSSAGTASITGAAMGAPSVALEQSRGADFGLVLQGHVDR